MYVAFDVLYRLLRQLQYDVQYVRNFTDIDDKIINRAKESDEDPLALSQRFIHEFHRDMADLSCLPPTVRSEKHCMVLTVAEQGHPGTPTLQYPNDSRQAAMHALYMGNRALEQAGQAKQC